MLQHLGITLQRSHRERLKLIHKKIAEPKRKSEEITCSPQRSEEIGGGQIHAHLAMKHKAVAHFRINLWSQCLINQGSLPQEKEIEVLG